MKLDFRKALQVILAKGFWQAWAGLIIASRFSSATTAGLTDTPQVVRIRFDSPPFKPLLSLENIESDANIA
jgi:hypothetical protein